MAEYVGSAATGSAGAETPPHPNNTAPDSRTTRIRRTTSAPYPASRPPCHNQGHASGSRVDAKIDEAFVNVVEEVKPFLQPEGKRLAAWAQLADVAREKDWPIATPRGLMFHFKYLCDVVARPTHKHHNAIQGALRKKLLACIEMINNPGRNTAEHATPRDAKLKLKEKVVEKADRAHMALLRLYESILD